MRKGLAWYKRYPQDFIQGTSELPLEARGAYSLIIDMIYDKGGPIDDNPRWIAGLCNVSVRKWNSLRRDLIRLGKIAAADGKLTNDRAIKEIENALKISRKRAESGAKSRYNSRENGVSFNENNGLAEANATANGGSTRSRSQMPERESKPIKKAYSLSIKEGEFVRWDSDEWHAWNNHLKAIGKPELEKRPMRGGWGAVMETPWPPNAVHPDGEQKP